jgi:hypothetical protein
MSETPEEKKKKPDSRIEIEVKNEGMDKISKILENQQNQQAKDEPTLEALILSASEQFNDFEFFKQATSKPMLKQMIHDRISELSKIAKGNAPRNETPSGSAYANERQYGAKDDLYTKDFSKDALTREEAYKNLILELRERASNGDTEAQSYLDSLTKRFIEFKKSNPNTPETSYNPNASENLPPLKKVGDYETPIDKDLGDIGSMLAKWRKDRLRKMGIKQEGA